jgi:hypothetical protein
MPPMSARASTVVPAAVNLNTLQDVPGGRLLRTVVEIVRIVRLGEWLGRASR